MNEEAIAVALDFPKVRVINRSCFIKRDFVLPGSVSLY